MRGGLTALENEKASPVDPSRLFDGCINSIRALVTADGSSSAALLLLFGFFLAGLFGGLLRRLFGRLLGSLSL